MSKRDTAFFPIPVMTYRPFFTSPTPNFVFPLRAKPHRIDEVRFLCTLWDVPIHSRSASRPRLSLSYPGKILGVSGGTEPERLFYIRLPKELLFSFYHAAYYIREAYIRDLVLSHL